MKTSERKDLNMINNVKKATKMIIVITMVFVLSIPVLATTNKSIHLPANQVWMTAGYETRSGDYSYVSARNHTVYPPNGTDTYKKFNVRLLILQVHEFV